MKIKFRAWHPALKRMFYNVIVHPSAWTDDSTHYCGEHKTLMQFTGLLDKNNVEIYEGDILRHKWDGDVMSHPGEAVFTVKHDESANYLCFDCLAGKRPWTLEIIGNIYELNQSHKEACHGAVSKSGS